MTFTPAVVIFDFAEQDGTPARGTVTATPNSRYITDEAGHVAYVGPKKYTLDENGQATVELPPTDDATLFPDDRQWSFNVALQHSGSRLPTIRNVELAGGQTYYWDELISDEETAASYRVFITRDGWDAVLSRLALVEGRHGTTSVNDVEPVDGNVTLTAADVGAEPAGTAANLVNNLAVEVTEGDAATLASANAYTDALAPIIADLLARIDALETQAAAPFVEDPVGSGLYAPPLTLVEDPPGSGLYDVPFDLPENPTGSGLYQIGV